MASIRQPVDAHCDLPAGAPRRLDRWSDRRRSGGLDGVEAHGVGEGIGVSDDPAHGAFGIEPRKVVAAEVVLVDVVGQHVPGYRENRMLNGDNGFRLTKSGRRESSVTRTKLGVVLGAGYCHGGGSQGSAQPPVSVTGL